MILHWKGIKVSSRIEVKTFHPRLHNFLLQGKPGLFKIL